MTVDEQLRAVMHAHDVEAPTRVPWPAPATGRTERWRRPTGRFALAVALVAVLAAAGTWLTVAWPQAARPPAPPASVAPLTCPTSWSAHASPVVPAAATVPGASDRLVPDATPGAVVVCGYVEGDGGPTPGPTPLTGAAILGGDLAPFAGLSAAPRVDEGTGVCDASVQAGDGDDYLIGLSYGDGTVWVSAPGNHCSGSYNGVFATTTNLHAAAAKWLAVGSWLDGAPDLRTGVFPPTCPIGDAAWNDADHLVTPGPATLTVCWQLDGSGERGTAEVPAADIAPIVAAANAVPTGADPTTCDRRIVDATTFTLVFGYDTGTTGTVTVVPSCPTALTNGRTATSGTGGLVPLLEPYVR